MRSVGGLMQAMVTRENLTAAVWLAAKGRRQQPAVRTFLANLSVELDALQSQLTSGELHCGECHTFTIHDPKERLITAPVFRERVLHHAIMRVCGPVLERRLIHHSYACRVGKGTYAALEAAQAAARKGTWFVKLDVRKYFQSIDHGRLMARLARVFRERQVLDTFRLLLAAYAPQPGRGLPIGTLISQHLANFYLATLDVKAVQDLRPLGYVRYMDDMALWVADAAAAKYARESLVAFAQHELGLEMKTAFINRSQHGMDFLGHRVFPHRLGLNHASRRRYQHRLQDLMNDEEISEATAQERAVALTAFTQRADCVSWRRRVIMTLGGGPRATSASCAAAPGTTTAGTPLPASATGTSRRTATRTSACVSPPAPAGARSAWMEPACCPAPQPFAVDETQSTPPPVRSPRVQRTGPARAAGTFSQATPS
ncbi:Reverse transcriptase (RNA-dependent DNA polymerase) [Prosthecobacter debontii]|uniref:Reverse transcriptase (RNA-dependent DNA polymerase) n=1 Tax=Prosthecobacter debontii TaxID=48467 RepID=A0A1T4YH99_9BACT|nr:reverse transcriptase/maturase family protein [Prosthecobacter debontii]SKB01164.1 Reverse transcriptase (RNA-dependent DNA polymerase) [Prosthecobacter debontii]